MCLGLLSFVMLAFNRTSWLHQDEHGSSTNNIHTDIFGRVSNSGPPNMAGLLLLSF